jgi:hypothetical protein
VLVLGLLPRLVLGFEYEYEYEYDYEEPRPGASCELL